MHVVEDEVQVLREPEHVARLLCVPDIWSVTCILRGETWEEGGGILRKQLVNHGGVAEGRVLGFRSRGGDAGPAQDQEDRGDNAEKLHVGRALGVCIVVVSGVC